MSAECLVNVFGRAAQAEDRPPEFATLRAKRCTVSITCGVREDPPLNFPCLAYPDIVRETETGSACAGDPSQARPSEARLGRLRDAGAKDAARSSCSISCRNSVC